MLLYLIRNDQPQIVAARLLGLHIRHQRVHQGVPLIGIVAGLNRMRAIELGDESGLAGRQPRAVPEHIGDGDAHQRVQQREKNQRAAHRAEAAAEHQHQAGAETRQRQAQLQALHGRHPAQPDTGPGLARQPAVKPVRQQAATAPQQHQGEQDALEKAASERPCQQPGQQNQQGRGDKGVQRRHHHQRRHREHLAGDVVAAIDQPLQGRQLAPRDCAEMRAIAQSPPADAARIDRTQADSRHPEPARHQVRDQGEDQGVGDDLGEHACQPDQLLQITAQPHIPEQQLRAEPGGHLHQREQGGAREQQFDFPGRSGFARQAERRERSLVRPGGCALSAPLLRHVALLRQGRDDAASLDVNTAPGTDLRRSACVRLNAWREARARRRRAWRRGDG